MNQEYMYEPELQQVGKKSQKEGFTHLFGLIKDHIEIFFEACDIFIDPSRPVYFQT